MDLPSHRTQDLAARLRSVIEAGSYGPGQLMPSERDLSAREGVSRTTVRRAIQLLVEAGVLYRMPGSGTYVGRPPLAEAQQEHATIGMIVPSLANPYFGELATAIEREAKRGGYQLLLGQADLAGNNVAPYLERYAENPAVLGVIAASASDKLSSAYRQFVESGKPLVFVVRHADVTGADSVATDHVGGARELVRHLIALGHRRIAFIGGRDVRAMRHYQGYLEGLREADIPADPNLLVEIDGEGDQIGVEGVGVLLGRRVAFTAIFAQIDLVAIGVLRTLRTARLRVPQDVSLVGFDNIPSSEHLDPPLTTVDHSVHEIGRLAVMLLQDRITGRYDGPARRVIIQPQLVLRESCGPPALTPSPSSMESKEPL